MLDIVLDDNLKQKGMAREIVNKIQKLRKVVGLNIDDHVEIFYTSPLGFSSVFTQVVEQNIETIQSSLRTTFRCANIHHHIHFVKIAETEYINPVNEFDVINLVICAPNVAFDMEKLKVR